jgi:ketosteroid isomerase-like protein
MNQEAAMQFWSRDRIMGELRAVGLVSNAETILNYWKNGAANRKAQKFEVSETKVDVLSPEMALVFSKGLLRIELKNGNISNNDYANTTIWVKEPDGWKMAYLVEKSATRQ